MRRSPLLALLLVLTSTVVGLVTHRFVSERATLELGAAATDELVLARQTLSSEIARHRSLPRVISNDPRLQEALDGKSDPKTASLYLEKVRDQSGAAELFLLDASGLTIASSNHASQLTFVGQNYRFRPYFIDAIRDGEGQFFAVGATTGIPGYFLATRVVSPAGARGVSVVKVDLAPLVAGWQRAASDIAVADGDGIVFLTSVPEWQYRPLATLPRESLERLVSARKYGDTPLAQALPIFDDHQWQRFLDQKRLADGSFLLSQVDAGAQRWSMIGRKDSAPVRTIGLVAGITASLMTLLLGAGLVIWHQRRSIVQLRLSQTEELEHKVTERTRELEAEIDERKQVEETLRSTQEELIHTAKIAALGQMSAAIVHEVSQPLAAMENTLAAAGVYAERGDGDKLAKKLSGARDTIGRMQRMVQHLKSFARRDHPAPLAQTSIADAMNSAITLAEPRRKAVGANITTGRMDAVSALSGMVRLEQVFLNLIVNALDAVEGHDVKEVKIEVFGQGRDAVARVTDTGPGIGQHAPAKLLEPFYSTKLTGEGLGLGLAISRMITEEFGGTLALANSAEGGAVAEVRLPSASETDNHEQKVHARVSA